MKFQERLTLLLIDVEHIVLATKNITNGCIFSHKLTESVVAEKKKIRVPQCEYMVNVIHYVFVSLSYPESYIFYSQLSNSLVSFHRQQVLPILFLPRPFINRFFLQHSFC